MSLFLQLDTNPTWIGGIPVQVHIEMQIRTDPRTHNESDFMNNFVDRNKTTQNVRTRLVLPLFEFV